MNRCNRCDAAIPPGQGLKVFKPRFGISWFCGSACLVLAHQPAPRTLADVTVTR